MTVLRLLLIDDDADTFALVRDFVAETTEEWTVDWASTYETGIEGLSTGHYDAALLDYHLGTRNGLELLAAVRTMEGLPPIVLLTGQGDRTIDLAAMATGAAEYLEKGVLSPVLLDQAVRHAIDRDRAAVNLWVSEARYHGLFEQAGDALLIADDAGQFTEANPAACILLGLSRAEIIGRSMHDFVESPGRPADPGIASAAPATRGQPPGDIRIRRPDGSMRVVDIVVTADFTPGRHLSVLRDDTDRLVGQVALVDAVAALRLSEARFRGALDEIGMYAIILDTVGLLLFANRRLKARIDRTDAELIGANVFSFLAVGEGPSVTPEAYEAGMTGDVFMDHIESTWLTRSGERVLIAWTNSAIRDDSGVIVAVAAVGEDVTARRKAEETQAQLVAAIGQAEESIVVTDIAGRATYANPAFERISGIPVVELIGRRPATLLKGGGTVLAEARLDRRLKSGRPWSDESELRRRDGSVYREEVTTSPVRDRAGAIVNFVRVGRDVTHLREIQASLDSTTRDRAAFARTLAHLRRRDTPEETGQDILDAVMELPGVDIAALVSFEDPDDARLLALNAPDGHPFRLGQTIPRDAAAYLRRRAARGPWAEGKDDAPATAIYPDLWAGLGLRAIAFAPIITDDEPLGVVILGTTDASAAGRMEDQVSVAVEFAAAARSLIAEPLAIRDALRVSRRRIESTIAAGAFAPVFQPIVDLASGSAVGFEALTRFTDGSPPDRMFDDARQAGVGLDLEAATLNATMAASRTLPAGPWLALNVSPEFVMSGTRLAGILERRTRPVVLEITEHEPVANYAEVRAAIAAFGADVRTAVDDAGVGVANFGHIVELRPDFVKVDVSLVRGVNHDLTRQALIVGLRHFALATNGWVVAEGVETEEVRQTLIGLGLVLGQGYLFGRPAAVETWKDLPTRSSRRDVPQPEVDQGGKP